MNGEKTHEKKVQIDEFDYIEIKSVLKRKKNGTQIELQQISAKSKRNWTKCKHIVTNLIWTVFFGFYYYIKY